MKNVKTNEEAIFMNFQNENIIKLCSFYVSDWHLITMLLPYINKQIDEKVQIATILENNIEEKITTFVKKLKIPNEEKILKIQWKNKKTLKYNSLKRLIENHLGNRILIIVNGNREYINETNKIINEYIINNLNKIKESKTYIKIVDCYKIVEFNTSIMEILDNHDMILNTSGEREITDIFEDYVRNEKIS